MTRPPAKAAFSVHSDSPNDAQPPFAAGQGTTNGVLPHARKC